METKSAAGLLLLPLLLQLTVVFAAPTTVVQNANSTSQTCDSSKSSSYVLSLFEIRQKIVSSRPRNVCPELLTTTIPGQTISPTLCSAERYLVGKYIPLEIQDQVARADKLFEKEGSGAEEPERFCSSMIRLSLQSYDIVEGGDFALYKLPSLRSNSDEIYTVTVIDGISRETVMTKNVSGSARGWQITDISTYARTQSFSKKRAFYFNIYVKKSDGSSLPCQEMKTVFALDCTAAQETNNFPFKENILPALAVYNSGEFNLDFFLGKRSLKPISGQDPQYSTNCERVPDVVHLQDYVKRGYTIVLPKTVDKGQCVSPTTHAVCPPRDTKDLSLVVSREDGTETVIQLKNFITYTC